ncbi:hypothetical protein BBW65_05625 [Helicobacter enhydrae]|uniref:Transcriptional regulator n=1 Tax=Helicobacter enhydrae TaxID=222136 RepID=A0A1B1U6C2_9HELI|nr:hypothetical protein [Helicobacter enhydrae]ANV98309.1 hypothetical protein BBW65_05625 [Helicobacter enhydrae]
MPKNKNKTLAQKMRDKGIVLSVWAQAKGMSQKDIRLLWQISQGLVKGARGRAKELKEALEKDGIKVG